MSELDAKIIELESLKKSYEEFIESSAALEKELEDALEDSKTKYNELNKKKTLTEEKLTSYQEKCNILANQLTNCQKELSNTTNRLNEVESKKVELERLVDELQETVRILQATEEDLTHRLIKAEENEIFLQSDLDELRAERVENEKRLKKELTEIQAELAKVELHKDSNHHDGYIDDLRTGADHDNGINNSNNNNNNNNINDNGNNDDEQAQIIEELELEIEELTERLSSTEQQNQQLNEEVSRLADELIQIHEKHAQSISSSSQSVSDTTLNTTDVATVSENNINSDDKMKQEELNTKIVEYESKLKEAQSDKAALIAQLNTIKVQLDNTQSLLSSTQLEKNDINTKYMEIQQAYDTLSITNTQLTQTIDILSTTKISLENEIITLTTTIQELKEDIESLSNKCNEKDIFLSDKDEMINTLEIQLKENENEIERYKTQLSIITTTMNSDSNMTSNNSIDKASTSSVCRTDSPTATADVEERVSRIASPDSHNTEQSGDIMPNNTADHSIHNSTNTVNSKDKEPSKRSSTGSSGRITPPNTSAVTVTSNLRTPMKTKSDTGTGTFKKSSSSSSLHGQEKSLTSPSATSATTAVTSSVWDEEKQGLLREIEYLRNALVHKNTHLSKVTSPHKLLSPRLERNLTSKTLIGTPKTGIRMDMSITSSGDTNDVTVMNSSKNGDMSLSNPTNGITLGFSTDSHDTSMKNKNEISTKNDILEDDEEEEDMITDDYLILDTAELNKREVNTIINTGNLDQIKTLLYNKLDILESMRSSNAKLLQKLQAARGNIQVCCRTRPPNTTELTTKSNNMICVEIQDDNELVCYDKRSDNWKSFVFDRVWKMDSSQADVFADVEPLVLSVIEGYNTCLFAYGQTGSGKTFTMNGYGQEYGVSYRTLHKIFEVLKLKEIEAESYQSSTSAILIARKVREGSVPNITTSRIGNKNESSNTNGNTSNTEDISTTEDESHNTKPTTNSSSTALSTSKSDLNLNLLSTDSTDDKDSLKKKTAQESSTMSTTDALADEIENKPFTYKVEVAMMEIYNDNVYDLLNNNGNIAAGVNNEGLDIRQAADGTVHVPGLKQVPVNGLQDVLEVFKKGSANRATAATSLNELSSRSHSILVVDVTTYTKGSMVRSKLYLVDLAGSERASKSGVSGMAMKETQHINKSLSALGDVMEALDQKAKHIPYRNSKLTYLLQDSLGGNSRTMMIVTICPTELTIDETLFTLGFASRVRNVNLGIARKNINAKNIEEALKISKNEVREIKKKNILLEEQVNELKKLIKKNSDKMSIQSDNKNKIIEDMKKSLEGQLVHIQKTNQDLLIRLTEEKEIKTKLQAENEILQKTLKKTSDHLKEVSKEREKISATLKQRELDLEKEREKEKELSALSKPPTRMSTVSSDTHKDTSILGPPRRDTFIPPTSSMKPPSRRLTKSVHTSSVLSVSADLNESVILNIPTTEQQSSRSAMKKDSDTTLRTSIHLQDIYQPSEDPGLSMINMLTDSSSSSSAVPPYNLNESMMNLNQSMVSFADQDKSILNTSTIAVSARKTGISTARMSTSNSISKLEMTPRQSTGIPSRPSTTSHTPSSTLTKPTANSALRSHSKSTDTQDDSKSARRNMTSLNTSTLHTTYTNPNSTVNSALNSPVRPYDSTCISNNSILNISPTATNELSTNSTTGQNTRAGIASRSREALLRHQERMEKFRQKQTESKKA